MVNNFFFGIMPYLTLLALIAGMSTFYFGKRLKITSLSSQFLESNLLFWGSNAFHYGLAVLFCGHLIAFIAPTLLIAWNTNILRLIIVEIIGFSSGLLSFLGLIILIYRRLIKHNLQIILNSADIALYVLLFVQIFTGLWIAVMNKWGSAWFASTLTPYNWSVFKFNPDVNLISAMPLSIKLHIVNAFLLIAIIPFTRLIHFMALPFSYIYRSYILVVWNYKTKESGNYK
jgi:nitrate reductase gamma subunit